MGGLEITGEGKIAGMGRVVLTPAQRVNLLSENQILDQKLPGNRGFKYDIRKIRNLEKPEEGYSHIYNPPASQDCVFSLCRI